MGWVLAILAVIAVVCLIGLLLWFLPWIMSGGR